MARLQTAIIIFVSGWIAVGCGVVPRSTHRPPQATATTANDTAASDEQETTEPGSSTPPPAMAVSSLNEVQASLMQAYRDWKGTPYQLGGASQEGVDCSMLVNVIFDKYFDIDLPTNTRAQLNVGNSIRRAGVRTGDLVFFRTGRKSLHVGVAVNQGEFLHASTSNGVMISKLGNSYWRNRFFEARRVL